MLAAVKVLAVCRGSRQVLAAAEVVMAFSEVARQSAHCSPASAAMPPSLLGACVSVSIAAQNLSVSIAAQDLWSSCLLRVGWEQQTPTLVHQTVAPCRVDVAHHKPACDGLVEVS